MMASADLKRGSTHEQCPTCATFTLESLAMAKILIGLDDGSHVDMPQTEFIECSAYRLEPITKGSYNNVDREVVEAGPIQGTLNT